MWRDKAAKSERRAMQTRLAGILGIELPAEDFKHVPEEDGGRIEQRTRAAEDKIDELIAELSANGYGEAAAHVRNAKDRLFTYVRFWLATGLISPRASSMIERMKFWLYAVVVACFAATGVSTSAGAADVFRALRRASRTR